MVYYTAYKSTRPNSRVLREYPVFAREANRIKPTDFFCQPDTDSPVRTLCSFLKSVFADLDIAFFDIRKVLLQLRKHVQLYSERTIFDVLPFFVE